ncbi:hypothetical protein Avbf_03796 [Armadillidium vulgare]|nr:hypothetical protein Avbf_03796 [Armadillidium vulgare]
MVLHIECRTLEFNYADYHVHEFEIPNNTNLCLLCLSNCADFNSYKMNVMIVYITNLYCVNSVKKFLCLQAVAKIC